MNSSVTHFLDNNTIWKNELSALRSILLECALSEEFKWKQPCYTYRGENIVIIGGFKSYATIGFFKGALLLDEKRLFIAPGENSQSTRLIKFYNTQDIENIRPILKDYIFEAIEIEKSGQKVPLAKSTDIKFSDELVEKMNADKTFKSAFESLTPGRQRAYHLYFSAAKQSKTRIARIEKYLPRIMDGFGFHDCVCGLSKRGVTCDGSHKYVK